VAGAPADAAAGEWRAPFGDEAGRPSAAVDPAGVVGRPAAGGAAGVGAAGASGPDGAAAVDPAAVEAALAELVRAGSASPAEVRQARAWLSRTVEPGSLAMHRLLAACGPVAAMRLIRSGRAPAQVSRLALARQGEDRSLADLAAAERLGVRLVTPEDDEWPDEALHAMELATSRGAPELAPPQALWVRGALRLDEAAARAVAIVGSRAASSYGSWMAGSIAHELAERGWTIVSGGAYGIDGAAHRGALAAGGATIVLAAGGLQRPYPGGHTALFDRVAETGLLVSEWPPDCPPQRHRFIVRNRLIAALAAGTVVVEAARRSGARSTARRAQELGRAVMAVPGTAMSATSVGTHEMIRDEGACLVTSGAQVLELVGALGADLAPRPEPRSAARDGLGALAQRVLDGMPAAAAVQPDRVAVDSGVPVGDVLRCLPALELAGFVRADFDGWRLTPAGRR
jgi:DNA processing protein